MRQLMSDDDRTAPSQENDKHYSGFCKSMLRHTHGCLHESGNVAVCDCSLQDCHNCIGQFVITAVSPYKPMESTSFAQMQDYKFNAGCLLVMSTCMR